MKVTSRQPFNKIAKAIHKDRVGNLHGSKIDEYLRKETLRKIIANQLVDRINDISPDRVFTSAADIGSFDGSIWEALDNRRKLDLLPDVKFIHQVENSNTLLNLSKMRYEARKKEIQDDDDASRLVETTFSYCKDNDFQNFCPDIIKPESQDIIISCLSMHWINDIQGFLNQVYKCLKPDGVFLGAIYGGDTLFELRASFAAAEQEREGGLSAHVSPMLPAVDACSLLQTAGFNLITVDTNSFVLEYDNAFALMKDLAEIGESNASTSSRAYTPRDTMLATAAIYDVLFGQDSIKNGKKMRKVPATYEIVSMIGWKPAPTQPKPLARGSGQVSLKVLGSKKEKSLDSDDGEKS